MLKPSDHEVNKMAVSLSTSDSSQLKYVHITDKRSIITVKLRSSVIFRYTTTRRSSNSVFCIDFRENRLAGDK